VDLPRIPTYAGRRRADRREPVLTLLALPEPVAAAAARTELAP
jgi:hypothetical protein